MYMVWLIFTFLVIALFVFLIRKAGKGPQHSLSSLRQPITDLLRRGYNGGFLIIDVSGSKFFVQFRKYINKPKDYGIELSFPQVERSGPYFDRLISICKEGNYDFEIVKEKQDNESLNFLYVDFGQNISKAHNFVKIVIVDVFDLEEDVVLYVRLENASIIKDELIEQ
ncbi:MAG TPA: hypothetical protein EYP35_06965 [Desulfobacterales bacterium]|nr:hypothetical protein [Desulfobacterales bacterium]